MSDELQFVADHRYYATEPEGSTLATMTTN